MSDIGFIVKNGVVVGENTRIQGNTLSIYSLVNMSYASNVQVADTDTVVDVISKNITRSAKYHIQIIKDDDSQVSELLLIQAGNISNITEYGVLTTGEEPLVTFTTTINGSTVVLKARTSSGVGSLWYSKTSINTVQTEAAMRTVTDRSGNIVTDRNGSIIETRFV